MYVILLAVVLSSTQVEGMTVKFDNPAAVQLKACAERAQAIADALDDALDAEQVRWQCVRRA